MKHTKEQLHKMQDSALSRLVTVAGSQVHLARMLGTPVATVRGWIARGRISKAGAENVQAHETLGPVVRAKNIVLRPEHTNIDK